MTDTRFEQEKLGDNRSIYYTEYIPTPVPKAEIVDEGTYYNTDRRGTS